MQDLNLEGHLGARFCEDILKLDGTIIFASVGSSSGFEIASAISPAMDTLVGRDPQLKEKYCSIVAAIINLIKQSEGLLGKSTRIEASFEKNLRMIIIPLHSKEIFVFVVSTREVDAKALTFQISKLLQRFESSA